MNRSKPFCALIGVMIVMLFHACTPNQPTSRFDQQTKLVDSLIAKASAAEVADMPLAEKLIIEATEIAQQINYLQGMANAAIVAGRLSADNGDNLKATTHFNDACRWAGQSNHHHALCTAWMELGIIAYNSGEYDKALSLFSDALQLARQYHYPDCEATTLYYTGKYYHTLGEYAQSLKTYEQAKTLATQIGNQTLKSNLLLSIGKCLLNDGNTNGALINYLEAYQLASKSNDKLLKASVCNHLGSIYLILNQYRTSVAYHHQALNLRKAMNNPVGMARSHNNLGETYLTMNLSDSAIFHFQQSLDLSRQTNYLKGMVKALTNISKVHEINQHPVKALQSLKQALQMATSAGYEAGIAEASWAIGNLYLAMQQPEKAINSFLICNKQATHSNLTDMTTNSYLGLYKGYLALNNYPQSLKYLQLFSDASIARIKADNSRQLAELHILFESEKKEQDNEMLRQQNSINELALQRKNQVITSISVILILLALLVIVFYSRLMQKREAHRQQTLLNAQLELAIVERDKIMSIIAHELRNPLYWFQNLAEVLSANFHTMPPEKVKKSLVSLDESAKNAFHLMDNLLFWSRSRLNRIVPRITKFPLKPMIDQTTKMYSSILQQKQIRLNITCPAHIQGMADTDLLACVVRNLLSNAIKYTPDGGNIAINAKEKQSIITIYIDDSGIGVSDKLLLDDTPSASKPGLMQEKGTGFGLRLCKEFVTLNNGQIGTAESQHGGSCFWFTIPLG